MTHGPSDSRACGPPCATPFSEPGDAPSATRHGIVAANSPLFCLEEVSDHAAMLLLACARKVPHQIHALHRHGWHRPAAVEQMGPIYRIRGKTLGFVAFGKIARLTAEKMAGFDMTYLAHDPYLSPADVRPWNVELVSLDELCRRSDFVSMHALLNESTRGMFGEAQFRAMKATAYFVNTSRGGTVDELALIRAFREGWIAGAGLDVLEQEPPDPASPLLGLPSALLTPHTAGYSEDSRWPTTTGSPSTRCSASEAKAGARARARAFVRG